MVAAIKSIEYETKQSWQKNKYWKVFWLKLFWYQIFKKARNPLNFMLEECFLAAMCEICWKLTIKTLERRHWHRSGVFIVNFEQISHIAALLFPLLTLSK